MSKELSSLEAFKDIEQLISTITFAGAKDKKFVHYELDIIENALEEYEEMKDLKIRSLSDAEMKQLMDDHCSIVVPYEGIPVDANLPKKLKAFEIMNNHFNIEPIEENEMFFIKIGYAKGRITKEEYDLLREVLDWWGF